jgi:hypothetical protein
MEDKSICWLKWGEGRIKVYRVAGILGEIWGCESRVLKGHLFVENGGV